MTLSHATIDFAGIQIDTFLTEDEQAYATLTSIGKGLGYSRQTIQDWLERTGAISEGIPVKVGKFKKSGTAYPVNTIGNFLDYRMGVTGDEKVLALYSATFRADLISDIKRANLVSVTHAEQNELRAEIRMDLVNRMVKLSRGSLNKANYAIYMADLAEATEVEQKIASTKTLMNDTLKRMDKFMTSTKNTEYQAKVYSWDVAGLETYRAELEALGVSC